MRILVMAAALVFSINFAFACPCNKASSGCPDCGQVSMKDTKAYEGKQIKAETYPCESCAKVKKENSEEKGKIE